MPTTRRLAVSGGGSSTGGHATVTDCTGFGTGASSARSGAPNAVRGAKCSYANGVTRIAFGSRARSAWPREICAARSSPSRPGRGGRISRLAVRDLSFAWEPGEVLVLSGPNGAGKSTTLRLLLGLAPPTAGEITVGGASLATLDGDAWRGRIAYLAQRPFFPERATVREAIRLIAPDATDEASRDALARVGVLGALEEHGAPLDVRVGSLSVGQRQRVALARVLVKDAPVLVLDEPDANLDAAGIRALVAIVRELAATKMIVVVAHTEELLALRGSHVTLAAA